MLNPVLQFFSLVPDFDLALMTPGQTLTDLSANALLKIKEVLEVARPDLVIVQGDTTTALMGALAAFYAKVKVAHVEAGLRTGNKYSPFPEEMNRVLLTRLADYHFAPTRGALQNLRDERVSTGLFVTGNTVIDALLDARSRVSSNELEYGREFSFLDRRRRLILVTGHRRESFGEPFERICRALTSIASRFEDVELVYPVHLNPNVRAPVERLLRGQARIHLIEPVAYPHLVYLLSRATLVLTDSGGIQEEAPALGKPVLVMRDVTERPEGVEAGCALLVGTDEQRIVEATTRLLTEADAYARMAQARNPYGDGTAARQIADILEREL
jgi:UDP-N-acetylglucosamine 2-epimerase (non-hydrolysing)